MVPGHNEIAEHAKTARKIGRRRDLQVLRAEAHPHQIDEQQSDGPTRQQRHQRALVEMADRERLDAHADGASDEEDDRNCKQRVEVEQGRRVKPKRLLHAEGRITAQHDELALRQIDHAHQSEDDRETRRSEKQHAAGADGVVEQRERVADA